MHDALRAGGGGKAIVCRILSCQRAADALCIGEPAGSLLRLPVVIGSGSHPFPFRTRKLSLIPPMVLWGKLHGRVGRCRHYSQTTKKPDRKTIGLFCCTQ